MVVCYSEHSQCLSECSFTLHVDLATLSPAVKPPQGAALSRCQSNGDYGKSLPTSSTSRWCGKQEGLVAGSQQERLPGQTDMALSRSSVSSRTVLAGGRCHRHRPAKQSVLLKGVACLTHTHTYTRDHTNRGTGLVSNQSFC